MHSVPEFRVSTVHNTTSQTFIALYNRVLYSVCQQNFEFLAVLLRWLASNFETELRMNSFETVFTELGYL